MVDESPFASFPSLEPPREPPVQFSHEPEASLTGQPSPFSPPVPDKFEKTPHSAFSPFPPPAPISPTPVKKHIAEVPFPESPFAHLEKQTQQYGAQSAESSKKPAQDFEDYEEAREKKLHKIVLAAFGALAAVFLVSGGIALYYILSGSGDGAAQGDAVVQPEQPENLIIAEQGGRVEADGASIIIPSGALAADTIIEIVRAEAGEVTDRFELKPSGLKFLKPVTVVIPYKPAGLKAGETPRDINLKYWKNDEPQQSLIYTIDEDAKTLSTKILAF